MSISSTNNDTNDNDSLFIDQFENDRSNDLLIQEKRHRCYVYEESKRDSFLIWWSASKWTLSHTNQDDSKNKRLHWDSDKKAAIWEHFVESATIAEDTSKIICKRCHLILDHSFLKHDINTIKLHLSSKQCFEKFKSNDLSQLILTKSWKKVSRLIF
jgi:hypothetical protein